MGDKPIDRELSDLTHIAVSLALGLLVGIERGWAQRERAAGTRFAGVRTFALMGLAGGIAGTLHCFAPGPATVLLSAMGILVLIGYLRDSRASETTSGTGAIVALLTLSSGFFVGLGEPVAGTAVAVTMVLLLALREQLHGWISRLSRRELLSIARYALIALVILPLLPDESFGPFGAWNPRQLWLAVVLISGFSFIAYIATRMLGARRGIIATAAAGALVSATAVTASLAGRIRQGEEPRPVFPAAIAFASVIAFLRALVLVGILAPAALPTLARLIAPGLVVAIAAAAWFLRRSRAAPNPAPGHELAMRNPFDIGPALMLAGLVMVLTVASLWVLNNFGVGGLAAVLAISGTLDLDSAIITMGGLAGSSLDVHLAGVVLAIAVALNTLFRAGVALYLAGWSKGRNAALPLVVSALAIAGTAAILA